MFRIFNASSVHANIYYDPCVCVGVYEKFFLLPAAASTQWTTANHPIPHSSRALRKTTHDKIPSARKGKYCELCSLRLPVYPVVVRAGSIHCLLHGNWQL